MRDLDLAAFARDQQNEARMQREHSKASSYANGRPSLMLDATENDARMLARLAIINIAYEIVAA